MIQRKTLEKSIFGVMGQFSNVNADTLTDSGTYYLMEGITNAMAWSFLVVFKLKGNNAVQINIVNSGSAVRIRAISLGVAKEWKNLY